jgi:hypothetical protein
MSSQRAKSRVTVSISVFFVTERLAHHLDAARDIVLLDVLELAQDADSGKPAQVPKYDQRGG